MAKNALTVSPQSADPANVFGTLPAEFSKGQGLYLLQVLKANFDDGSPDTPAERLRNLVWGRNRIMELLAHDKNRDWGIVLALIGMKMKQLTDPMNKDPDGELKLTDLRRDAERSIIYSLYRLEDGSAYQQAAFSIWRGIFNGVHRDQFLFGLGSFTMSELLKTTWSPARGSRRLSPHFFDVSQKQANGETLHVSSDINKRNERFSDLSFRLAEGTWLHKKMLELWTHEAPQYSADKQRQDALFWLRTSPPKSTMFAFARQVYEASLNAIHKASGFKAFITALREDAFSAAITGVPADKPTAHEGHMPDGYIARLKMKCVVGNTGPAVQVIAGMWDAHLSARMLTHPGEAEQICRSLLREARDLQWTWNDSHTLVGKAEARLQQILNPSHGLPDGSEDVTLPQVEASVPSPPASLNTAGFLGAITELVQSATAKPAALPAPRNLGRKTVRKLPRPGAEDSQKP